MATRTNCAFLIASFLVIEVGFSAEQAWEPFQRMGNDAFATFRDASTGPQDYNLTPLSCLKGLEKAISLGWYSYDTFNIEAYERYDKRADLHVVTPKFIAFRGPGARKDRRAFPPEYFAPFFKDQSVTAVLRLNEHTTYDPNAFTDAGIRHYDLYFEDCSLPSYPTLCRFFDIARSEGRMAIHCSVSHALTRGVCSGARCTRNPVVQSTR